jgi:hypothetical protein
LKRSLSRQLPALWTAGVIVAQLMTDQAQITFLGNGSVDLQTGTSGTLSAPNCLDPRLLMCAA